MRKFFHSGTHRNRRPPMGRKNVRAPWRRPSSNSFSPLRAGRLRLTGILLSLSVPFMALNFHAIINGFNRLQGIQRPQAAVFAPHPGSRIIRGRAHIIDGDTISIGHQRIRLHGMDAPERHQTCRDQNGRKWYCGVAATRHLAALTGGAPVTCRKVTTDRYNRTIAVCESHGQDIGRRMVRDGWAVAYIRYSRAYAGDEAHARKLKKGIWRGYFTLPETWRHRSRKYR